MTATLDMQLILVGSLLVLMVLYGRAVLRYYDRKNDFLFADLTPDLRNTIILKALAGLMNKDIIAIRNACNDLIIGEPNVSTDATLRREPPSLSK